MYRFAACAVRKRTPPLSGIAECGRGRKRRYLFKYAQNVCKRMLPHRKVHIRV